MKSERLRLSGRLLVAAPDLMDVNFFQTIVYILNHDEEGAFGFVLNRPTILSLNEVIMNTEDHRPVFEQMQVMEGGPVKRDTISVLTLKWSAKKKTLSPAFPSSIDAIEATAKKSLMGLYVFRGHAGWGATQLEREIRDGSWSVCEADPVIRDSQITRGLWPFLNSGDDRWRTLVDYLPKNSRWN